MGPAMVSKDFMGRVFLPPAPSANLHINIGWSATDGQKYPEWMPIFQEAISKEDYDSLISKIKDYLSANSINACLPMCAVTTMSCGVGCFVCCYLAAAGTKITGDLKKIGEEFPGASVTLCQMTTPTAQTPDAMAFDQWGVPCQQVFGQGKHSRGQLKPCWPPLGYNIILRAPSSFDLRSVWPKNMSSPVRAPIPCHDTSLPGRPVCCHRSPALLNALFAHRAPQVMPTAMMPTAMQVMPTAISAIAVAMPVPESMGREDDAAAKLMKLKELFDAGAIDQVDYDQKKAELLNFM